MLGTIIPSESPAAASNVSLVIYLPFCTVLLVLLQALGDELGEILENQRQLEEQLDGLLQDGGKGNGQRVSRGAQENVHSITAAAHGIYIGQY